MPSSVVITPDEAVAALTAGAWTEPVSDERYVSAVETARAMCRKAGDGSVPAADVLAAIERELGTPRTIIHCFLGALGCDWELDTAIALVREAEKVGWAPSIFRHELAAMKDGKVYRFDVRAPEPEGGEPDAG